MVDLFSPAVRAFGNIAVVGQATSGAANEPQPFTSPADAKKACPGNLGNSIATAFQQSPGPALVYGVRTDDAGGAPDWAAALDVTAALDVQFVVLANTPLTSETGAETGAVKLLAEHVASVSETGGDGMERMGVAMLEPGATDTSLVAGTLAHERMVYIAHKSNEDAAAAVAGVIAGYEPHVSILLKPVNINTELFTPAEIAAINGTESHETGPAGQGVNWLTDPVLIPGRSIHMGEGYTGNPGGKKYIDIVRTVDDVSFRLKARLIKSIGTLRISRSGLRSLQAQMEAVLNPLVSSEVIEGYDTVIPILALLDKDPASLTEAEREQIKPAKNDRFVQVLVSVDYAGAIHRLTLDLKFE
jgi:hypothetical protein